MATGFPMAKASNVLMTRYLGSSSSTNTPLVSWNMAFLRKIARKVYTSRIYWNIPILMKPPSSNMVAFCFKITHKIHQTLPTTSDKTSKSRLEPHGSAVETSSRVVFDWYAWKVRSLRYPCYGFTVRWKFGTSWNGSNKEPVFSIQLIIIYEYQLQNLVHGKGSILK